MFVLRPVCFRKWGRIQEPEPNNTIHRSPKLNGLGAETVLQREARQDTSKLEDVSPLNNGLVQSQQKSLYEYHKHEHKLFFFNIVHPAVYVIYKC
jgi:hypothetical protein